jgi:ubiquinone/menaquinone biosynthesis C-methylase UbiE
MELKDLMALSRGFWRSSVLFSSIKLRVFNFLEGEWRALDQITEALQLDHRGGEILLNALVVLGLIDKREGKFKNNGVSSRYLVEGSPDYKGNLFMHSLGMWEAWGELAHCAKTGKPLQSFEERFLDHDRERVKNFILGMDQVTGDLAELLTQEEVVAKAKKMLDIGGGPGTYCRAFILKNPDLQATIFDLPLTLEVTGQVIKEEGMEDKIFTREGDILLEDPGSGYDLVLVSQLLHSFSAEENTRIIQKAYNALVDGGTVMINEYALDEDLTDPTDAAMFSVNMLVNTKAGRAYKRSDIISWMEKAGFQNISSKMILERVTHFQAIR